ncbi:MAG: cation-translocating P-type ATPase [Desulfosarcina sp.]|nr:cation-translocating P-type ATPase [Desulfobacterales bacterium]
MRQHLLQGSDVTQVETRLTTGSVIITFEPERITIRSLLAEIFEQVLHPVAYKVPEQAPGLPVAGSRDCDCAAPASLTTKLRRVILLTAFVVYAAIRSWIFKLPLAQNPLSLVAMVAVVATAPLIRKAAADVSEKKGLTLRPFLAAGCIVTIAMGEAFTALEIIWVYNAAELTEDYVAERSRRAIRNILEVAPVNAFVMIDGMEVETKVGDLRPDDIIAVHTGEKIPVDGVVTDGKALVEEASINGRAEATLRSRKDSVFAGTIVSQGTIFIRTVKTGEETYLAGIMHMVEASLANKAPVEQKADELASRLMKIGFTATFATLLLTADPMRALTVMLVMACPCATVLAAGTAVMAAVANAARRNILIKGGLYLETVGQADVYCFDKTGTLTMDQPEIVTIAGRTPSISRDRILSIAATAESHNQHPMARAILAAARERGLSPEPHATCEFKMGRGVLCTMRGGDTVYLVGNRPFMDEQGVDVRWFNRNVDRQVQAGNTVVYVAKNGKVQGMIGVANRIRPEAVKVLRCLRADGVKSIHLVTGDNKYVAETMMKIYDFDDCRAQLLPEDKAQRVDELKNGNTVVMVGDGINDALALAHADIGIAMGAGGAEVAMEAADIALVDSDLESLMKMRNLSHQTMAVIDQNHFLAVSTDLIGVALAMAGILSPIMAGMIHLLHTGGILINSSRLLGWEPPDEPMAHCHGCLRKCLCGKGQYKEKTC